MSEAQKYAALDAYDLEDLELILKAWGVSAGCLRGVVVEAIDAGRHTGLLLPGTLGRRRWSPCCGAFIQEGVMQDALPAPRWFSRSRPSRCSASWLRCPCASLTGTGARSQKRASSQLHSGKRQGCRKQESLRRYPCRCKQADGRGRAGRLAVGKGMDPPSLGVASGSMAAGRQGCNKCAAASPA